VPLRHIPSPPTAITLRIDSQYFALNQKGPDWEAIVKARNACFYVPSEFGESRIELLVLLP
jgi:type VI secretion system protein ImpJ